MTWYCQVMSTGRAQMSSAGNVWDHGPQSEQKQLPHADYSSLTNCITDYRSSTQDSLPNSLTSQKTRLIRHAVSKVRRGVATILPVYTNTVVDDLEWHLQVVTAIISYCHIWYIVAYISNIYAYIKSCNDCWRVRLLQVVSQRSRDRK